MEFRKESWKTRAVKKGETIPTEAQEQVKFVAWLTNRGIPRFAIPNEAKRSIALATRLKRMGLSAGVPDVFIPVPFGDKHGLFVELKRSKGGRCRLNQEYWHEELRKQGYAVVVAHGCVAAMDAVEEYFGGGSISMLSGIRNNQA